MDQSQPLTNAASIILGYRGGPMHLIEKRVVRRDGDIAGQKLDREGGQTDFLGRGIEPQAPIPVDWGAQVDI